MKSGQSVLISRPSDGPPRVYADAPEALADGRTAEQCEQVPIGMAIALSVREHHDWHSTARALARTFVAQETGRTRVRFTLDSAPTLTEKLPRSVILPEEFGGGPADVLCAHEAGCFCGIKHKTRWLDVAGGLMVTVCSESRKVIWVQRSQEVPE